jgi:rhodanese-related sulfurtransferase
MEVSNMPLGLKDMVEEALATVEGVSARAVQEELEDGRIDVLIDVREPSEWDQGHVPGAINVPRGMLELRADPESPAADPGLSANRDARVIVYCLKVPGARSLLAAQTLGSMGYSNVAAMRGGFEEWRAEGLPAE